MSEVEVFGVKASGEVELLDDVNNSWAGAMHVWNTLSKKYDMEGSLFGGFTQLWKSQGKGILLPHEEHVLITTFDNIIIQRKDIEEFLVSFRRYAEENPVSNLVEQAEIIEKELESGYIGFCWNQTTVSDCLWYGTYDEETEEEIPFNIYTSQGKELARML